MKKNMNDGYPVSDWIVNFVRGIAYMVRQRHPDVLFLMKEWNDACKGIAAITKDDVYSAEIEEDMRNKAEIEKDLAAVKKVPDGYDPVDPDTWNY